MAAIVSGVLGASLLCSADLASAGQPSDRAGKSQPSDRAVTTGGDQSGFHVLVADGSSGYRWRTAATLSEPGVETDQWIGHLCVTGSGRRAVVAYGPREVVNKGPLFNAGALGAVVDLTTGHVTKLRERVTIAYHSPGCGIGERAVFSRLEEDGHKATTRLVSVEAATGAMTSRIGVPGQVSSAIPYGDAIAASRGGAVIAVSRGGVRELGRPGGLAFRLTADREGGLAYLATADGGVQVHRFAAGRDAVLGTGPLTELRISGSGGRVFLTGPSASRIVPAGRLPRSWRPIGTQATAEVSTRAGLLVTRSSSGNEAAGGAGRQTPDGAADAITITATVAATGRTQTSVVRPEAVRRAEGIRPSPALTEPVAQRATAAAADPSTMTTDPDRTCGVPRNDPGLQTFQPTPQQVEWAADLAAQGRLKINRGRDWHHTGLPAYTPQGMFPPRSGPRVPAQILLGVLAQESNMWQASPHAVDGETGNFHQGGFYGNKGNVHVVNWRAADCGYGAAQVTDGMCRVTCTKADGSKDNPLPAVQQKAIAVDYAANIAQGMRILQDKWNETARAGVKVNNGDPRYIENWWFALWAYNSGYHPKGQDPSGQHGLGWTNNPLNSGYDPQRKMFLSATYDDAKHPERWSYSERVTGFAAYSLVRYNFVKQTFSKTFAPAYWPGSGAPAAQPPLKLFCSPGKNQCDPDRRPACQRSDDKCWWHDSVTWTDCAGKCGQERLAYPATSGEPSAPVPPRYKPSCISGLPPGAIIVDDVATPAALGCPSKNWTSRGSLRFRFTKTGSVYPSKIDFHQIGAGWGGHFWFAHSQRASRDQIVTGSWSPGRAVNRWTRVMVHIPNHGAHIQQAHYKIYLGGKYLGERHIPTRTEKNRWINLGVFDFRSTTAVPRLELSNATADGLGTQDIAWDAAAFAPLPAKPKHFIVAIGDSYASGEGAGDYYGETDNNYGNSGWNACRRSLNSWVRNTVLPGGRTQLGSLADSFDPRVDLASVACSGAQTFNVDKSLKPSVPWNHDGQFNEIAQLDSGFLDSNTTLVALTLGGNDAHFTGVVKKCQLGPCPPNAQVRADIDTTVNLLGTVLKKIKSKARNAKIVLLGYPDLFNPAHVCRGSFNLTPGEQKLLNTWGDYLSLQQAREVVGLNVKFYSPNDRFKGHRVCDAHEAIHGVTFGRHGAGDNKCPSTGTYCISRVSFHPTSEGTKLYALAFTDALRQIRYSN